MPDQRDHKGVFFIKQKVANACGTTGLVHALINVRGFTSTESFKEGGFLENFYVEGQEMTPDERADALEKNVREVHAAKAQLGSSKPQETAKAHFVTFVEVNGRVWELDGRLDGPIDRGEIKGSNLGIKVTPFIQRYIEMDKEEMKFSIIALAPSTVSEGYY